MREEIKKIYKKYSAEFFYKSLFLIPVFIGISAFKFLHYQGKQDLVLFGTIAVAVIATIYGCVRYGWDEERREKIQKYNRETDWRTRDNGAALRYLQQMIISIVGFILVLIIGVILSFFNLL